MSKGEGWSARLLSDTSEGGRSSPAAVQTAGEQGCCKLVVLSFLRSRCVPRAMASVALWNLTVATYPFTVAFFVMFGGKICIYWGPGMPFCPCPEGPIELGMSLLMEGIHCMVVKASPSSLLIAKSSNGRRDRYKLEVGNGEVIQMVNFLPLEHIEN